MRGCVEVQRLGDAGGKRPGRGNFGEEGRCVPRGEAGLRRVLVARGELGTYDSLEADIDVQDVEIGLEVDAKADRDRRLDEEPDGTADRHRDGRQPGLAV